MKNYIVAVGASAGGLEAIKDFFAATPNDAGCIWVVIQHLSPDYDSAMKELLASSTSMPIHMASEKVKPIPDNIYLIPKSVDLRIDANGKFVLSDQERHVSKPHLPIDIFFASIAEHAGERAVAVVLSGTGSDGTKGARTIREVGGLVCVQDFTSAKFDGMPKSIINNGLADFVGAVGDIPNYIVEYTKHPYSNPTISMAPTPDDLADNASLKSIFKILNSRFRTDFSSYKNATILRRIERRISKSGQNNLEDYLSFMMENEHEVDELLNDLLIGVTSFFRDISIFNLALCKQVDEYLERTKSDEVRIWVAGCSSG